MLTKLRLTLLLALTAVLFGWWVVLLVSNVRDFLRGDNGSGVLALIIFGALIAALATGVAGYRRYQREWKKRVEERS
jgi:H+/Cl- antiporter ClcA